MEVLTSGVGICTNKVVGTCSTASDSLDEDGSCCASGGGMSSVSGGGGGGGDGDVNGGEGEGEGPLFCTSVT